MNPATILGFILTSVGIVGYALGVTTPYPGRAFSITLVMIGITLLAIRRATKQEAAEQ